MHRTEVRAVEVALDANSTIASANRSDLDRADATVVAAEAARDHERHDHADHGDATS